MSVCVQQLGKNRYMYLEQDTHERSLESSGAKTPLLSVHPARLRRKSDKGFESIDKADKGKAASPDLVTDLLPLHPLHNNEKKQGPTQ